MTYNVFGGGH